MSSVKTNFCVPLFDQLLKFPPSAHSSSSASGSYPSGGLLRQDSNLDGSPLSTGGLGASTGLSPEESHSLQRVSAANTLTSSGVGPLLTGHLHGLSISPAFSSANAHTIEQQQQALGHYSPSHSGPQQGSTSSSTNQFGGSSLQRHQHSPPLAHEIVMKRENV